MFVNTVSGDYLSHFSSTLTFFLGIASIVISGIFYNDACEHNVSLILLITGIFLVVTFIADRILFFHTYFGPDRYNHLVHVLLVVGCVVMSIVLSCYTFSISPRHHVCNDVLYWYSFAECIILLLFSAFVILALVQSRGMLYNTRSIPATTNVPQQTRIQPVVATNRVDPIRI